MFLGRNEDGVATPSTLSEFRSRGGAGEATATWSPEELDSSNDHSGNANASAYGPAQRCHLLFRNKCLDLFNLLLDRGDIGVCCHSVHPLFQERDARIGVTSHY